LTLSSGECDWALLGGHHIRDFRWQVGGEGLPEVVWLDVDVDVGRAGRREALELDRLRDQANA